MAEAVQGVQATQADATAPVIAKAGRYYRVARYLMTVLLAVYGAWSIYDGFVSWPHWTERHPNEKPKSDADILLNRVLGVVLPPLGVFILVRALYVSRGEYRLEDGIVYIPGHPPVPLQKVHSIDRELWDRKGIAYVEYDLADAPAPGKGGGPGAPQAVTAGQRGVFKLDDFVYERDPTDLIFKAIEASLLKAVTKPAIRPAVNKLPPRPRIGSNI